MEKSDKFNLKNFITEEKNVCKYIKLIIVEILFTTDIFFFSPEYQHLISAKSRKNFFLIILKFNKINGSKKKKAVRSSKN